MSNWGLLRGIGRGLNQFGDTLNRGMAADITAQRRDEDEARRQASIEKRWAKQDAEQLRREKRQDERFAKQDKRQSERDRVSDSQHADRINLQKARAIESNISGVMNERQQAENDIYKRYQKLQSGENGIPPSREEVEQLNTRMQADLEGIREKYSLILEKRVASYGDKLRGTGYSYLLDTASNQEANEDQQAIPDSIERSDSVNTAPPQKEPPRRVDDANYIDSNGVPSMIKAVNPIDSFVPVNEQGAIDMPLLLNSNRVANNQKNMALAERKRTQAPINAGWNELDNKIASSPRY